jgi:hypothetical protein
LEVDFLSLFGFNELIWICFALIDLTAVVILFRYFGRVGLIAFMVFSLVLCNIQVLKVIELFGITTTLGNILYAGIFLATDILNECYGKKEARRAVLISFIFLIMAVVYMQLTLVYIPASVDFAQPHLEAIFGLLPRVALASLLAYLLSHYFDIWAFATIKKLTGGRFLWLRNSSTLVSQLLDSIVFCAIAFYGLYPFEVVLEILLSTYIIKVLVAILDTPFIYAGRKIYHTYRKKIEVEPKENNTCQDSASA